MRTGFLPGKEPVIRFCTLAAFFPVLVEDLFQAYREFDLAGITTLADFFRDRNRTIGKGNVAETKGGDFAEPKGGFRFFAPRISCMTSFFEGTFGSG